MQSIEQPRALVDINNKPTKGKKGNMTQNLVVQYPSIISQSVPDGWIPELVILDDFSHSEPVTL